MLSVYFVEQSSADVIGYIDENIVVVSTSYRIVSFGFLNVNPLKDTAQDKNVGLYGSSYDYDTQWQIFASSSQ